MAAGESMGASGTGGDRSNRARVALTRSALALQSDERLVELARRGSPSALEVALERYRKPLLAYCTRLVDRHRAEDVVQETLAKASVAINDSSRPLMLK